jgi:hypothetical protein
MPRKNPMTPSSRYTKRAIRGTVIRVLVVCNLDFSESSYFRISIAIAGASESVTHRIACKGRYIACGECAHYRLVPFLWTLDSLQGVCSNIVRLRNALTAVLSYNALAGLLQIA